jgi:hypothetical protein
MPAVAVDGRGDPADRRQNHVKAFFYQFLSPRRGHKARRATDSHAFHVDFHEPVLLVVVLVTISLCVVDVYATLTLLQKGGVELNPLMRELINTDVWLFYSFKYIVTAAGLFVLLSFKRFRVYKNFNALHTLYGVMAIYVLIVVYQMGLLSAAVAG